MSTRHTDQIRRLRHQNRVNITEPLESDSTNQLQAPSISRKRRCESTEPGVKRPKYIQQPNDHTCGPTALYNLVLWAQPSASPRITYRQIEQLCQSKLPLGTTCRHFEIALTLIQRKLNLRVNYVEQPSYNQITQHLDTGGVILLEYHWDERPAGSPISRETYGHGYCDHFVLVIEFNHDRFIVINHSLNDPIIHSVSRREFKRMLWPFHYDPPMWSDPRDNQFPIAWFISRPSN